MTCTRSARCSTRPRPSCSASRTTSRRTCTRPKRLSMESAAEACEIPRTTWFAWELGLRIPPGYKAEAFLALIEKALGRLAPKNKSVTHKTR